jgi:putative endonuclease
MKKIGRLGEQLVSLWLESQGYEILARNWSCRWGEIDLIAQDIPQNTLAFVEVKTRRDRNWDEDGKNALNLAKQTKLEKTASLYLAQYPELAELNCRFDLAVVRYRERSVEKTIQENIIKSLIIDDLTEYVLQEYLYAAFDLS